MKKESRILNIETSADICSVALSVNGLITDTIESARGRSHAVDLSLFTSQILERNQINIRELNAVAVSKGPGSYTGLRIGVSFAKGICYAAGKPLIGIFTHEVLTKGLFNSYQDFQSQTNHEIWFCPTIDARRMELYVAFYDEQLNLKQEIMPVIVNSESFHDILETRKVVFFGDACEKCRAVIVHPNAVFIQGQVPLAKNMCSLSEMAFTNGKFEDVAYFEPFYLKDFQATTPKNKIIPGK